MTLTYILLAIYILSLFYIGWRDHRTEDANGFIIADRKVGVLGTLGSVFASVRHGGIVTTFIFFGFAFGYKIYTNYIGIWLAFFMFILLANKIFNLSAKHKFITVTQAVKNVIGKKTEKVSSVIVLLNALLLAASSFFVLGTLISSILGISSVISIIISIFVIGFYVCMGGYKSIIKTDVLQFFIMALIWCLIFFIDFNKEAMFDFKSAYNTWDIKNIIFAILQGFFYFAALPDTWQRTFSAKSAKVIKKSFLITIPIICLIPLPLTWIGMSVRGLIPVGTGSGEILSEILNSGVYNSFFTSIFVLVIISASMSTLDTLSYVFSSTLQENFLKMNIEKKKKQYITSSKVIMTLMLIISAIIAFSIKSLSSYMFQASTFAMILSPLFFLTFSGFIPKQNPKFDNYLTGSLIVAILTGLYFFIKTMNTPLSFPIICIPVFIFTGLLLIGFALYKLKWEKEEISFIEQE
jgi:solute:Na+ symporter, SSS family